MTLIKHLDARQQTTLSAGAEALISKSETPEHLAERFYLVAASVLLSSQNGESP
jgi:hypothetical protein